MPPTREVTNQLPPLAGHDVFRADTALVEAVARHGDGAAGQLLSDLGCLAGTAEAHRWGAEAEADPPTLVAHDRYGHRVDEVRHRRAWHDLCGTAVRHGLHGRRPARRGWSWPPQVRPALLLGHRHTGQAAGAAARTHVRPRPAAAATCSPGTSGSAPRR